jgi:hypothetical protein
MIVNKPISLEPLYAKEAKVKYGFAKELLKLAAKKPNSLYLNTNEIGALLQSENNTIVWAAIDILGYLSLVDTENKIDKYIPQLVYFLHSGKLTVSAQSMFALSCIAKNKPQYKELIFNEIICINNNEYESFDCKNIAIGKAIDFFSKFKMEAKEDADILNFIQFATQNARKETSKKAQQLVKQIDKLEL